MAYVSALSINVLPNEILSNIFENALASVSFDMPRSDNRDMPHIISSVCTRWRRIALHTPILWSHIDLAELWPNDEVIYLRRRLKLWLERSRGAPIHIYISRQGFSEHFADKNAVSLLRPYASCIVSLISSQSWNQPLVAAILNMCETCGSNSLLKTLVSLEPFKFESIPQAALPWTYLGSVKSLVHLELAELRHPRISPNLDDMSNILSSNPSIRLLRLRSTTIRHNSTGSVSPITMDNLQLLDLVGMAHSSLELIMSILNPGKLEIDIRLDLPHVTRSDTMNGFLELANVVSLMLYQSPNRSDERPIPSWFPLMPSVQVLTVVEQYDSLEMLELCVLAGTTWFPNLRILYIEGTGLIIGTGYQRLEKTTEMYPLDTLVLSHCGFESLLSLRSEKEQEFIATLSERGADVLVENIDANDCNSLDIHISRLIARSKSL